MRRTVIVVVALLAGACARAPLVDPQQVTATFVAAALPTEDPAAALWNGAPEHPARLMVQDITEPRLTEPGVELVRVRALHDRARVVFRLDWDDATRDVIPDTGSGSDAVAIQFPIEPGADVPDAAMGQAGKGVLIWFWKAVWQDDAERAAAQAGDRIAALYPNASVDHYPFDANPAARREMQERYAPALAAGNPITLRPHTGPVQVLSAEGFGNAMVPAQQEGTGRGVWARGRWSTTIARPLTLADGSSALTPGRRTYVAFAVWDGAAGQTGSRKMRSGWIPLVLEAP